jgi:hypothetical protein
VGEVRVKRAADDKDRPLGPNDRPAVNSRPRRRDWSLKRKADFRITLTPPKSDAKMLSILEGEALVTSASGWTERRIAVSSPDAARPVDLGDIVPGAKLSVDRFTRAGPNPPRISHVSGDLSVTITGARSVKGVIVEVAVEGVEKVRHTIKWDRTDPADGGRYIRTIELSYSAYVRDAANASPDIAVVAKRPADARVERVRFTLKELDLF